MGDRVPDARMTECESVATDWKAQAGFRHQMFKEKLKSTSSSSRYPRALSEFHDQADNVY
jgi:hypothetical protein